MTPKLTQLHNFTGKKEKIVFTDGHEIVCIPEVYSRSDETGYYPAGAEFDVVEENIKSVKVVKE